MASELSEGKIMQALDWAYDKAVNGVVGMDSAGEMAANYMSGSGSLIDQANSLIRWQNTKAGTSGFLTGLGGIITMPVAIPANVASVMYVQIRMIAAIAHMGGNDLNDDRVKTLVYACLTGNAAKDILKDIGIVVGRKLTESTIKNISGKTITAINQKVGFRLLTKFGEKGVINLGKTIPLIGGVVGATFDSMTTNAIGNIARDTFIVQSVATESVT
ncbi:MAG: EcsC family protein [Halopseudomonas sp.]|uniref:EcsC family protein n=1 Tax=Halopseudomonas sp. TaxID=2901191 RepID=UPI003001EDCD